jgi:DNA-binding beta-propeller fold protein YncE
VRWSVPLLAAALACAPGAASGAAITFAAPAGDLPVEHLRNAVYDAVLPSGRIVTPLGANVVTGTNALGMALSPDGRFAVVSNADERAAGARSAVDPRIFGGYSLAVIDVSTMQLADRFALPGETYFAGVAAVRDPRDARRSLVFAAGGASNAVYVFDLDAHGRLTPDLAHVIPIAGPLDPVFGDFGHSFPATLVAAPNGRRVYAVDEGGGSVTAIDTFSRAVSGPNRSVGFFPFGAALAGDRLYVTNEGLMRYARVIDPPLVPAFATPPADGLRASSLSLLDLTSRGDLSARASFGVPALALDPAPDGSKIVGGAHPTALAVTADGAYAFIAMTNVDRIASVSLSRAAQVVGGTELRLFDRGPYGTQPAALALSHDGTRLYVALAGLNAVAVLDARDPLHLHRLGLLPTGWFPSALALSADDRTLYVVNTKGFGHDSGSAVDSAGGADSTAVWSTLQKIDLGTATLADTTFTTLKNTRDVRAAAPQYPRALQNVVVIIEEDKTFDSMLGDLGYGPADPANLSFSAALTPNLHALARRFALAGNFFADAEESNAAHQFIAGGAATLYSERTLFVRTGRRPLINANEDPEDYPRAGYIFNNLERHHISFRDYGDLVRLAGYDEGEAADRSVDDPAFAGLDDVSAPTRGLGGRYAANVPAPAVLAGHVDLDYPGWNLRIRDERRAREFIRDYTLLVGAGRQPRYTHIWLPADHTGAGPNIPPVAEEVADGDRALGTIVQYLSRLPSWRHTAIFILADDAQASRDHVDAYRSYALVVSPYAKRHYVGMRHLSTVSVLKTAEQILDVPPLGLGDLLATDMSDFFTPQPDSRAFAAAHRPGVRTSEPEPSP